VVIVDPPRASQELNLNSSFIPMYLSARALECAGRNSGIA
jgi:hypothetical protein